MFSRSATKTYPIARNQFLSFSRRFYTEGTNSGTSSGTSKGACATGEGKCEKKPWTSYALPLAGGAAVGGGAVYAISSACSGKKDCHKKSDKAGVVNAASKKENCEECEKKHHAPKESGDKHH